MQKFRPLKIVMVALIALTAVGMVDFHYIEHWGWFDSFYMVVITLSTVALSGGASTVICRTRFLYPAHRFRRGIGVSDNRGAHAGFARIRVVQGFW